MAVNVKKPKKLKNRTLVYRILSLMLAAVLTAGGFTAFPMKAFAAGEEISSEYKKVTENDSYELYLYEPSMSVILRNKETGALLRSTLDEKDNDGRNNNTWTAYMQSGIVITAIKGTTDTYQVDLIGSPNDITYTYNDHGFSAKIYFKEYEFGLTVNVSLEENSLAVEVPDSSIIEESKDSYIGTVSLFPLMGYSYLDDKEGYMFIPDGNGALIYLDDKDGRYTTGFSQMIYGSDIGFSDSYTETLMWGMYDTVKDTQHVLAPVFGMMHTSDKLGYLAVVEEGEERASIEAHPNGVMVNYNRCFAKFLLRRTYVQPLNNSNSGTMINVETDRTHSDLKVRYLLLAGEKADYSGMAVAYRNYLLDNELISARDTSYKTRVDFLGSDREQFLLFTKAVPMTTTKQIREMYEEFQAAGVESLLTVYKGWQKGGIYHVPITKYKADGSIGGTGSLTELIKDAAEQAYDIYLYNDALYANPAVQNTTFSAMKRINKRRLEIKTYARVYDVLNYLQPTKTVTLLDKFTDSYTKKGVANLALSGITNNLFSYSNSGNYYNRFDCAETYGGLVNTIDAETNLILEKPFQYLWKNTEAFLDMPMGSSNYMYVDEEIPFLSMVLKGILPMYGDYVNFEANKNEFRLQLVESGVFPSFYLTYENSSDLIYTDSSDLYSTQYETYKDEVIAYDKEFRELAQKLEGALILRHEKLQNQVNKVTYDNGTVIYINYSKNAVTADGFTVDAVSYKVVSE